MISSVNRTFAILATDPCILYGCHPSRAVFHLLVVRGFTEGETQVKDVVVHEIDSTQRRRRLRLIKAEDEQTDDRFRSAASILAPASTTEAARFEVERIHRRMMMDCRAKSGARIRIEFPGEEIQFVTMNQPYLLIGRDPHCDLKLDHEAVHPRHIFLQWVNGQIFWCDIAPRENADQRQPSNGNWFDVEPISIGPYRLSLDKPGVSAKLDDSPLDRSSQLADEFPQLAFQFVGVEQSENLWSVNRILTMIGRGSQCKLRLNHPSMPYVQACLLRTRHCCWLVDIEGTGTTGVNGRAITVSPIDIGDILQLGPFRVEVVTKSISKPDSSATSRSKTPRNVRQASRTEARNNDLIADVTSKSSATPVNNPVELQSATGNVVFAKDTGVTQLQKEPTINGHLADPGKTPDDDPKVNYPVVADLNLIQATEKKRNVAGADQPSSHPEELPGLTITLPATKLPTAVALDPSIASFIKAHELQLLILKAQLERIKAVYEKPRSQSISKQARSMLDKAMCETMKTHELMYESIKQLTQQIK